MRDKTTCPHCGRLWVDHGFKAALRCILGDEETANTVADRVIARLSE